MTLRKSFKRVLAAALLAGGAFSVSSMPASAALIHDISITAGTRWQGSGQIIFEAETGNSISDLAAFSLTSDSILLGIDDLFVGFDDITAISWSVDPLDWSLVLDLVAETSGGETVILSNDASIVRDCLLPDGTGTLDISGSCLIVPDGGGFASFAEDTRFAFTAVEPSASVPEPTTLALFGLGLAGLAGFRGWRTGRCA